MRECQHPINDATSGPGDQFQGFGTSVFARVNASGSIGG